MGEEKGLTLVHLLAVVLSLVAFGFAVAAERRGSTGHVFEDSQKFIVLCLQLRCRHWLWSWRVSVPSLEPVAADVRDSVYVFRMAVSPRLTSLVAQTCLVAGAKTNAYHTQYREAIYAHNLSCATLRKGVFIARAVFVIATMVRNIYYYAYFSLATSGQAAQKANRASSTFGMTGYA